MDANSTEDFLSSKYVLWIVAILTVALFLTTNLPWQLDDYDQAKQAFTSFEMIKEGHWFYQRTPHEHVATKPPLIGWISAGLFATTRSWDMAWRLPSFLAAIATMIILFRAAASAYGSIAALIASSAFVFNLLTPRLATLVRTDMPLALVIFLIGLLIWKKVRQRASWNKRDRFLIFALLAAAMLIKGPIVYAFLLPGIIIFQCSARGRHGCHFSAWSGWWPWIFSLLIFLVWVIGGIFFQHGFFDQVVVREFLGRFGTTIHQPKEIFFYLPHLLHKFFPWSVFMIGLAIVDLRLRRWRIIAALREMSPETLWLLCWSLGGLVVMSIIPSKRVDRIFPVIPPLCLLLATQIKTGVLRQPHGPSWTSVPARFYLSITLLVSIVFTSGYAGAKVVSSYHSHRNALVTFGRSVRDEAAAHRWRYEVLKTNDEGLLLYLERTHFVDPQLAVTEWNRGNLDALVAPIQEAPTLLRELRDATLSGLKSGDRRDGSDSYALITR